MLRRFILLLALFVLTLPPAGQAHSYKASEVMIGHPWALPSSGNDGMAFVALLNRADRPDRLVAAHAPVAERVEIMEMVDGQPSPVTELAVEPNRPVAMRPGMRHLRLVGLTRPLKVGDRFPLTLEFATGGTVEVEIFVETHQGH